jgi:hypothetical protein
VSATWCLGLSLDVWERTIAGGCVPRIELIPLDQMAPEPRWIVEEGVTAGPFAMPVPPQIFAYNTSQILMTNAARTTRGQSLHGLRA